VSGSATVEASAEKEQLDIDTSVENPCGISSKLEYVMCGCVFTSSPPDG